MFSIWVLNLNFKVTRCVCLQRDHLDEDCITELAVHHGITKEEMKSKVSKVSQYEELSKKPKAKHL